MTGSYKIPKVHDTCSIKRPAPDYRIKNIQNTDYICLFGYKDQGYFNFFKNI